MEIAHQLNSRLRYKLHLPKHSNACDKIKLTHVSSAIYLFNYFETTVTKCVYNSSAYITQLKKYHRQILEVTWSVSLEMEQILHNAEDIRYGIWVNNWFSN